MDVSVAPQQQLCTIFEFVNQFTAIDTYQWSLILQKVQLLHNCTSVYIIVPMLTYKKIHFVYKKDTALVCHPLPFCKIWRRHVWSGPLLSASQM